MKSVTNRYRQNFRQVRASQPAPLKGMARPENEAKEAFLKKSRSRRGRLVVNPEDQ